MKDLTIRDVVDLASVLNITANPALRDKLQKLLFASCDLLQDRIAPAKTTPKPSKKAPKQKFEEI